MEVIMAFVLIAFLAGLPRSLWCIPAFILLWGLSGGSSGGGSGSGDNIGYVSMPFVLLAIALWGVYSNIRRDAKEISIDRGDSDDVD